MIDCLLSWAAALLRARRPSGACLCDSAPLPHAPHRWQRLAAPKRVPIAVLSRTAGSFAGIVACGCDGPPDPRARGSGAFHAPNSARTAGSGGAPERRAADGTAGGTPSTHTMRPHHAVEPNSPSHRTQVVARMARTVALLLASATALVPPATAPARPATQLATRRASRCPSWSGPRRSTSSRWPATSARPSASRRVQRQVAARGRDQARPHLHARVDGLRRDGPGLHAAGRHAPGVERRGARRRVNDAMQQIFLWISFVEVVLVRRRADDVDGSDRQPSDFGLDPWTALDAGEGGGHSWGCAAARHVRVLGRRDAGRPAAGKGPPR